MSTIEELALKAIYRHVDLAIEELLTGNQKKAIVRLRGILPKGYHHSFTKDKTK